MGLSIGQAIGIGIVVGFVGALALVTVLFCIPTTPPGWVVKTETFDEPVRFVPGLPQEALTRREADPMRDTVRHFPVRMVPLGSVPQVAEAVEFQDFIRSFAETCINGPHRKQPHVPESLFDEDELVRLAGKPINGGTWSASISNIATRASAVKYFLAQFIFKRIHPNCPPQECLLPPEIASCYQFVCTPHENPRREDLAAIWRESMYLLLESPLTLLPLPPGWFKEGDPRKERTLAMVPVIIDALHLESLRTDRGPEDRLRMAITGILEQSANSALHLLAQPAEWEAVWAATEPGFLVFPEIRLVWNGFTKFSKPAEVDADIVWPMPSDDKQQPDDKQHPEVDAVEQSKPDAEKLPSLEDGHSVTLQAGQEPGSSIANQ